MNTAHNIKVGDIFVEQWGATMTLVNYYQVIQLKGRSTVVVHPIRSNETSTGFAQAAIKIEQGREIKKLKKQMRNYYLAWQAAREPYYMTGNNMAAICSSEVFENAVGFNKVLAQLKELDPALPASSQPLPEGR